MIHMLLIVKLFHDKSGVFKRIRLIPVADSGLHGDSHRGEEAEFTTVPSESSQSNKVLVSGEKTSWLKFSTTV